jgi:hypothetical protein
MKTLRDLTTDDICAMPDDQLRINLRAALGVMALMDIELERAHVARWYAEYNSASAKIHEHQQLLKRAEARNRGEPA